MIFLTFLHSAAKRISNRNYFFFFFATIYSGELSRQDFLRPEYYWHLKLLLVVVGDVVDQVLLET